MTRKINASESPMRRAISRWRAGIFATITPRKTRLSMPSTISIALKATKLAQACGSVSQSIIGKAVSPSCRAMRACARHVLIAQQFLQVHAQQPSWSHSAAAGANGADKDEIESRAGQQEFNP